jgi:hypothetical protein
MSLVMAMIPITGDGRPSSSALRSELGRLWPELPSATDVSAKDDTFSFRIGALDVIAGLMPAPIPWSDLEGPCKTSWLWKDAEAVLRKHTNHLILTVSGDEPPKERLKLLTQVTTAILATCPEAVGVFWSHATLVIPPKVFREFAIQMTDMPLYLWIDFRVGKGPTGKSIGFTTGMQSLELMELETEDSPELPGELRERLFGLAVYLGLNGPVIKDGDTIGESARERIKIVYADSAFGHEGKVMRLEYGGAGKKPWWQFW